MTGFKGAFQSTTLGATIRTLSGNRLLKFQDEVNVPEKYIAESRSEKLRSDPVQASTQATNARRDSDNETLRDGAPNEKTGGEITPIGGAKSPSTGKVFSEDGHAARDFTKPNRSSSGDSTLANQPLGNESGRDDTPSAAMQADPEKAGDPNLVTWYGPNDPENP
jgi:hypothetical protein